LRRPCLVPDDVLTSLLVAATHIITPDAAWLLLRDRDAFTLVQAGTASQGQDGTGPDGTGPDGTGPDGTALQAATVSLPAEPGLAEILGADKPVLGTPATAPAALRSLVAPYACWAALPMAAQGSPLGVLVLASRSTDAFSRADTEIAAALVAQGMTAYEKASLFARARQLATTDELTGVANRRHFLELAEREAGRAHREDREIAVAMIDIDLFKRVNDTYGHLTGDDVIREVAHRVASALRAGDLLGRYGGEEFALLVPAEGHQPDIAERLRAAVADTPVATRSGPLPVTISIGLAATGAHHDYTLTSLLAAADDALYRAKSNGRNSVHAVQVSRLGDRVCTPDLGALRPDGSTAPCPGPPGLS
jgi:diguanylate cyclase (GGDEF)-like protein